MKQLQKPGNYTEISDGSILVENYQDTRDMNWEAEKWEGSPIVKEGGQY